MSTTELPTSPPYKVRLVWRLVLCLLLHLALLLGLAFYLGISLTSIYRFAPLANAEETQLESVNTAPVLLEAMDAERRAYMKSADPRDLVLFTQMRQQVLNNLGNLDSPLLLPTAQETERRTLIHQWMGDASEDVQKPVPVPAKADARDAQSRTTLDRIKATSVASSAQIHTTLTNLEQEESEDASSRVTWMWIMVGSVIFVTILIQLGLANSIIGPIQTLTTAVRRLQSGDYSARARLRSSDEIQSLGDTFNAMAENILRTQQELEEKNGRLSQQQESLRHSNAGLEERVAEKTEQIRNALAELEDKNRKLNEAAQLKDGFLATLSHELRTPLTPVIACAHLLSTEQNFNADQLKNVDVIERNARALSRMIDELLDLSAVMNRKLRLTRESVEMNEWTRATLEMMRPMWERRRIELTFVPAPDPLRLEIDPPRLAQVLTNLVNNAIKYTDAGGRVTVRLSALNDVARIEVTDTGAGLNRHEIEQIFEMFHQARTRRTESVAGLGVGLTVARSLAELHGGGLLADSPGPGRGATFTLWLPRVVDFEEADPAPQRPLPSSQVPDRSLFRGRRILLVEDSTDTREALQRIFMRRGCEVTTADSGETALTLAIGHPPDIILSDIGLPGISGLELMGRLRERPEFRDTIAVALSGLGREQDVQAARAAGFNAHLIKPTDIAVLDETLVQALHNREERLSGAESVRFKNRDED